MRMWNILLLISSCLFISPLTANRNNEQIFTELQNQLDQNASLKKIKQIARKHKAKGLLSEIRCLENTNLENLGISQKEFLTLIHFINRYADDRSAVYRKEHTGLSHAIEYDHNAKKYFIVLEGDGVYLGEGVKKTVTKALYYQKRGAKVVARGIQTIPMPKELALTKYLQGSPGLFKTLGFCKHKDSQEEYSIIYSKLYNPGSLDIAFKKNLPFTLYEKVRIARGITRGLATLHRKGIVHRDLGVKNYLINIPKGRLGKRKIEACIADFGRASYEFSVISCPRLQGNTRYQAPEGHLF